MVRAGRGRRAGVCADVCGAGPPMGWCDSAVAAGRAARGSQTYLGPRARWPGDMMIDRCDVRSHVVSECVEGGWLMPGT